MEVDLFKRSARKSLEYVFLPRTAVQEFLRYNSQGVNLMRWQFWNNGNKVGNLPERMARQIGWKFGLDVETMKGLQHASTQGPMKTLLVRVFDPKLLVDGTSAIRRYGDLDSQQSAIQFECRWYPRSSKLNNIVDLRPA